MSVRRTGNVAGGAILLFHYYCITSARQIRASCHWDSLPGGTTTPSKTSYPRDGNALCIRAFQSPLPNHSPPLLRVRTCHPFYACQSKCDMARSTDQEAHTDQGGVGVSWLPIPHLKPDTPFQPLQAQQTEQKPHSLLLQASSANVFFVLV